MSFLRVLFLNVLFIRINFNIVCIKSLLFTYWPHIFGHSHEILITGRSGSDKTIVLLNLIKNEPQILTRFTFMSKIHAN